jgi:hypothetical protein
MKSKDKYVSVHNPTAEKIQKYIDKGYKVLSDNKHITVLEYAGEKTFKFFELSEASQRRAIKNTKEFYPESYPKLEDGLAYSNECIVNDIEENELTFNKKGEIIK